jgi:hypothetical protein
MPLPDLDVARVKRWCAARVPEHARHQVRVECETTPRHLTILERRALARRLRTGMDQLPDRPAALHHHRQNLDPVLARPQPALPPLRPTGPLTSGRRSSHRARPRPHRHLLGLIPARPQVGQLPPSQRGQFRLTSPHEDRHRSSTERGTTSVQLVQVLNEGVGPGATVTADQHSCAELLGELLQPLGKDGMWSAALFAFAFPGRSNPARFSSTPIRQG